jgi:hypothetical protein
VARIAWLTPPAHGHVNPTLPVVRELVRRGEQVVCHNTEEFRPKIEQTGAAFRAYPPSELTSAAIAALLADGNLANITGLILRATERLLPPLVDELARDRPDLVVFDSIALWGRMAASRLGLRGAASVTHFVMDERHMTPRDVLRLLPQVLPKVPGIMVARRRLARRWGSAYPSGGPLFPMRDRLTVVFTTRELQPDTPLIDGTFRFVGPSIESGSRGEEPPLAALGLDAADTERVVYISLGTILVAGEAFVRACFDAFADFPARFVFSVGRQTPLDGIGPVPANFVVRQSVPQLEVLQRTDAFVTAAGMNSVHEGLYHGVPLVLVPQQFEQLLNARRVAARGAGVLIDARLRGKPVTAAALREATASVLSDPRYRSAAGELRRSLRASGGYRQAADELQAYAAGDAAVH